MPFLILVVLSFTLFGAFLLLTVLEARYGRVGVSVRAKLDKQVTRATFIVTHVDWSAFMKHVIQTGAERVVHDTAHGTLQAIRCIERILTRLVRSLRERRVGVRVAKSSGQSRSLRETLRGIRMSFIRVPGKKQKEEEVEEVL